MIRGLWDRQAESIIEVKIGNADAYSYVAWWETIKKDKHGKHCNNKWK